MRKSWLVMLIAGSVGISSGCGSTGGTPSEPSSLVSISASGAVVGDHGRIRVTFLNPVGTASEVTLTSTSTSIAAVPDHVTVPAGAAAADVEYTAVAPGRVVFYAIFGSDTQSTTATVVDILRLSTPSGTTFEVGAHGILSQDVNILVPDAITLSLASSQTSIATVDSEVTIPELSSSGLAQITAVNPGTSVITASYNGQQATQTITVVDKARIAQGYGPTLLEIGGHDTVQISLTAQLANATEIAITSSNPSVVSTRNYTIAEGSDYAYFDLQATAVGSTNLEFSLNGSISTLPISVLSTAQLESVDVIGTPSIGVSMPLEVSMGVVAATAHDVTLTSSDPTVVAVPSTITVFAGKWNASTAIMPLKAGRSIITATYNGISRELEIVVGASAYGLNLYGQNRYVVGTIGQLSIQTDSSIPTTVDLVSSDPTVVSVSSSVVVTGSEVAPLTVLHTGTATITASMYGTSATFPVSVVASPGIQQFGPSFTVPSNGSISSYLYLDTQPPAGTTMTFASSDASIASAPASITVFNGQTYIPLTIRGGKTGTALLTVTVAGATATAVVYVGSAQNGGFTGLFVNGGSTIELGAATVLDASFYPPPSDTETGTITFGTPGILTTPSTTLTISPNVFPFFPVVGAVAGSSDVTLTVNGVSQTTTVTVVSSPTYTLQLPSAVKINASVAGQIFSDAILAADRTFTLSSSNPNVAAVTTTTATIGPGNSGQQTTFGVSGVAVGTATITATLNGTNYTANITVQ